MPLIIILTRMVASGKVTTPEGTFELLAQVGWIVSGVPVSLNRTK